MQLTQLFTLVALSAWGLMGGLAAPLSTRSLEKRVSGSKWSFYDAGLGACGTVNSNSDFIVALNAEDFGGGYPGVHCGKTITMTYGGKTTQAKIMDMCPGCPKGGLDLSRGLFSFFDSQDKGIIYGDWEFGSGSPAPAPAPAPSPEPPAPAPEPPAPAPSPSSSSQAPPPAPSSSAAPEVPAPSPSSSDAPAPSSSVEPSSSAAPSVSASSSVSPVAPAEPTPSSSSASPVAPSPSPSQPAPASPSPVTPAPVQDNNEGEYDDDEDCEEWEYYDDEDDVAAPVASPPAAAPAPPPQAAPVQQQPPSYNAPAHDVKAPSPPPAQLAPVVEKPVANAAPIPGASNGGDSVEKQIQDNMNMIAQLLNKLTEMIKSLLDKSQKDA